MNISVKKLKILTVLSILITSGLGYISHFAYDFFGQNAFAALFFPVNESTWEHLKLLFFPMLLCLAVGAVLLTPSQQPPSGSTQKRQAQIYAACYIVGSACGIYAGCISIVALFYTLSGIIGHTVEWLNIAIYYIAVILAYCCFYHYAATPLGNTYFYHNRSAGDKKSSYCSSKPKWLAILAITALCILFFVFTFYPPAIGLFDDPTVL